MLINITKCKMITVMLIRDTGVNKDGSAFIKDNRFDEEKKKPRP